MPKKHIFFYIALLMLVLPVESSLAAIATKARICSVKGTVATQLEGDGKTCNLKRSLKETECRVVNQKTNIETGPDDWAEVEYQDGYKIKIAPNTKVEIDRNIIWVLSGKTWFKVERKRSGELTIKTPTAIAGIRGTEFLVDVADDGASTYSLIEGALEVSDLYRQRAVMLTPGMKAQTAVGSPPSTPVAFHVNNNDKWWTDWPTLVPIDGEPPEGPDVDDPPMISQNEPGNPIFPIADSHVYAYSYRNWDKANWGKYNVLAAGWHPTGGEKRAFLKFDLAGVDYNSFDKATLKLFHYHTGGGNAVDVGAYRVMSPWQEGRDTYHSGQTERTAAPGEISWVNQPSIDRYPVVYFNPGPGVDKWVEVDITSLVKAWLSGVPNHGLVIKAGDNLAGKPQAQYGFLSREYEDIEKRPVLMLSGAGALQASDTGEMPAPGGGLGSSEDEDIEASYLGCYKDKGDRDLTGFSFSAGNMTTERCTSECSSKGFSYAATQYGTWCYCDNSYGKYGAADNCKTACGGNPDEVCGGGWANSVYQLDSSSGSLPFFEDFNSGSGNWQFQNKNSALNGGKLYWNTGEFLSAILNLDLPMENVAIEFDGYTEANGINVYLHNEKEEGYLVILGGWFNAKSGSDVGKSGQNRKLTAGKVWQPKQWHHYKIVRKGNLLEAFVDGRRIFERMTTTKFSGSGKLKFNSWKSRIGIDNVNIYRVTEY